MALEVAGALGWLIAARSRADAEVLAAAILVMITGFLLAVIGRSRRAPGAQELLLVAVLLRILLLPSPPVLSGDVFRYAWDGRVAAAGQNPYRLPPAAPELRAVRNDTWSELDHRAVASVYPPLALSVFALSARTVAPVPVLKSIFTLADLGVCVLLLALAGQIGVGRDRVLWYAWNPLAALESAASGHLDAIGLAALLLGCLLLLRRRSLSAAVSSAAAILAKIVPVFALPLWMRASRRPLAFSLTVLLVTGAAVVPIVASTGFPPGLLTYGQTWEFNGGLFEPLWRLLALVEADSALKGVVATVDPGLRPILNPYLYPQFLARSLLAVVLVGVVLWCGRRRELLPGTGISFAAVLLCWPVAWPWYGLWMLPFAALCAQPAFLALSLSLLAAYAPQLLGLPLWPWTWLAVWLPFFLTWIRHPRWSIA